MCLCAAHIQFATMYFCVWCDKKGTNQHDGLMLEEHASVCMFAVHFTSAFLDVSSSCLDQSLSIQHINNTTSLHKQEVCAKM